MTGPDLSAVRAEAEQALRNAKSRGSLVARQARTIITLCDLADAQSTVLRGSRVMASHADIDAALDTIERVTRDLKGAPDDAAQ